MNIDDIRYYRNDEVKGVLKRVASDREVLDLILEHESSGLVAIVNKHSPFLARQLLRLWLKFKISGIESVDQLQRKLILPYFERLASETTDGISYYGLENLVEDLQNRRESCNSQGPLIISNHILYTDPFYINYVILKNILEKPELEGIIGTGYSVFGNNISRKPWLGDILRVNRGIIYNRDAEDHEGMLSGYINTLLSDGRPVWIAQSGGRGKKGKYFTFLGLFPMLSNAKKDDEVDYNIVREWVNDQNVHPVAISYEYCPCDRIIAQELADKQTGTIQTHKEPQDINYMTAEFKGHKGRIHISFGKRLEGNSPRKQVDRQVGELFYLHDSHWIAYLEQKPESVHREAIESRISAGKREAFMARMEGLSDRARKHFINLYANPVNTALRYAKTIDELFRRQDALRTQSTKLEYQR